MTFCLEAEGLAAEGLRLRMFRVLLVVQSLELSESARSSRIREDNEEWSFRL